MLKLILYSNSSEAFEKMSEVNTSESEYILPSPKDADDFLKKTNYLQVFSIASYITKTIRTYLPEESLSRKSKVFSYAAVIYKKVFDQGSISEYLDLYKSLTEMRNNITSKDVLNEVLSLFEQKEESFFKLANSYLDNNDINDESSIYKKLSQVKFDKSPNEIHFLGFKFFNLVQLDFLKHLSQFTQVYIYLPQRVYNVSDANDWPYWADFDEILKSSLKVKEQDHNYKIEVSSKENFYLTLSKRKENYDYALMFNHNLNIHNIGSLGDFTSGIKAPLHIFEKEIINIKRELLRFNAKNLSNEKFLEKLYEQSKEFISNKDFVQFKIYSLFLKSLNELNEVTDSFKTIGKFEIELLTQIVLLDAPRVSLFLNSDSRSFIESKSLSFIDDEKRGLAFLDENYLTTANSFSFKSSELLTALTSVGIIKRAEFEKEFKYFEVESFLKEKKNHLIASGDDFIKNIFKFDLTTIDERSDELKRVDALEIKNKKENNLFQFSASRLQSYLNCPRKYFYTYDDPIVRCDFISSEISKFEQGSFEHYCIESFFSKGKKEDLEIELNEYFNSFFGAKKNISTKEKLDVLNDSLFKVSNGLDFLNQLSELFSSSNFSFEKEINQKDFKGYVDLVVENEDFYGVFDFKRSVYGIPTLKAIENYEAIQVTSYLNRLQTKKDIVFGYVCLEDLEKSVFFSSKSLGLFPYKYKEKDLDIFKSNYIDFEKKLINEIKNNSSFMPKPLKESLCDFCDLRNICKI